ncbi:hypothetical protein B0T20DRAFT_495256 [Sordaria brevicollis]|uniref:Major facilitator superfamily (MFS) profile domain-containing protein n=1 Tax=Sordaria brevicollis TaxID=83679 RepID=A0AAE0PJL4_SORBR|nr:hypothetical protein B0T20DRAFT_495256 [Sordaria brevicollis]
MTTVKDVNEWECPLTLLVQQDTKKWWQKPKLCLLYSFFVFAAFTAQWPSGYDSAVMNSIQELESWQKFFGYPVRGWLCLITAIYSLGALCSVPVVPLISNRYGRRRTIQLACGIMCLGAGLQAGATNFGMFVGARRILGFGVPFSLNSSATLLAELSHPNDRATITSLFGPSFFTGAILAAGVVWATSSGMHDDDLAWRIPSALQGLPSLLQVIAVYFCPESPRWLLSQERLGNTFGIFIEYYSEGTKGSEFARIEYAQVEAKLEEERKRKSRFIPKLPKAIGIIAHTTIQAIIFGKTCWELLVTVLMATLSPRFPRRRISPVAQKAVVPVLVLMFLYTPFYALGWGTLAYPYLTELFPYYQGSQGIAVEHLASRIALFSNNFVNPIALDEIG